MAFEANVSRFAIGLGLALAAAVASGAASDDGSTGSCRTVATELTARMDAALAFSATMKSSCAFDTALKQSTCTIHYADNRGTLTTSRTTSTYRSIADVVDEIVVIPPLTYAISTSGTQTGNRGVSTGSSTNTFDGSRRITKTVNVSAGGESTTTYTVWDAAGRPTTANDVGRGFSNTRSISYDDTARTRTTLVNKGPLRTVETFDAEGNQIATLTTSGPSSSVTTTAITVKASQRVCK